MVGGKMTKVGNDKQEYSDLIFKRQDKMTAKSATLRRLSPIWALAVVLLVNEAKADGEADAAKAIVHEHCAACHEVPGYESKRTTAVEAPSFSAMAADPGTYTFERLRHFLEKPHWPMEQFQLSPQDIDNLLAFIQSVAPN